MELDVKQLNYQFDIERIRQDYEKILLMTQFDSLQNQISLTHRPNAVDKFKDGIGSSYNFNTKQLIFQENEFTEFNENLKSTIFWEIYNKLPFKFGRIRLCRITPRRCYSIHQDPENRLHLAIYTQLPECFMSFTKDDNYFKNYYIPDNGYIYYANTVKPHSFFNTGIKTRIHLLFNIVDEN